MTPEGQTLRLPMVSKFLPAHWTWRRLDDLCVGIFDCPHSTPRLTETGPFVARTQDILTGVFRAERAARVSYSTYFERTKRAVPGHGDLLYSREGTYFGVAAEVPEKVEVCLGQRMVLIRPNHNDIDFRFLRHWLNSPFMASYISGFRDGSVAERLNLPTIRSLPILKPPLKEQAAIAEVVCTLEGKIAVNDRIAMLAEELVIGLVRGADRKNTVALRDIVIHVRDQVVPGALEADRVAHYSLPAFDAGRRPEIVPPSLIKSGKFLIVGPSVLVSKLNPSIRRIWHVDPSVDLPALASTEFLVLSPVQGVTPAEVWAVCSQSGFTEELTSMATGTSNSHQRVRPADLLATEVTDPRAMPGDMRTCLVSLLDRVRQAREESQVLLELRDALLPKLMSGEIRVRDAEKVVEDAL